MASEIKHITMHLQYSERTFHEGNLLMNGGYTISMKTVDEMLKNDDTIFLTDWEHRHVDLEFKKMAKDIEASVGAHMQMVRDEAARLENEGKEKKER